MKTSGANGGDGPRILRRGAETGGHRLPWSGETEMALRRCLEQVPFLKIERIETQPRDEREPDLVALVASPSGKYVLVMEAKTSGQPRKAREAINELFRHRIARPEAYGVLIAPYISPRTAALCEREGIGYVDLAGNCWLSFDQVYIRQEGRPNPFSGKRELRSLYSPKAERVLRALLSEPRRVWRLKELAAETGVSLGQVHNVRRLLADREWAQVDAEGMRLCDPRGLLGEWAESYDYERSRAREFYSIKQMAEIEADLAACNARTGSRYALTGFSAAARYAPFVRYQRATAYVAGEIDGLAGLLGVKEVPSGGNLVLLAPYDDGVFHGAREIDGICVVSPIQNYLDVRSLRARGEEAAKALLEQVIQPTW